jgi:hypothetical protein
MWRVDLWTAEQRQLTFATGVNTSWVPWQQEDGLTGVMDYRSAVNLERNLLIYFDKNDCHQINLTSLEDVILFRLAPGREPIAQNSITPDGKHLLYIDAQAGATYSDPNVTGTKFVAYDFDTGDHHVFGVIDHASHHILPYDDRFVIVNHPPPGARTGPCCWKGQESKWSSKGRCSQAQPAGLHEGDGVCAAGIVWADITTTGCETADHNCGWVEIYGTPNPPYDPGDPGNDATSCHQVSTPVGVWFVHRRAARDGPGCCPSPQPPPPRGHPRR